MLHWCLFPGFSAMMCYGNPLFLPRVITPGIRAPRPSPWVVPRSHPAQRSKAMRAVHGPCPGEVAKSLNQWISLWIVIIWIWINPITMVSDFTIINESVNLILEMVVIMVVNGGLWWWMLVIMVVDDGLFAVNSGLTVVTHYHWSWIIVVNGAYHSG